MKIVYIVNTRMPNQRAHGFQIAKTCEKFAALGNEVSLLYPYRKNDLTEDIFDYYGVQRNFKTETLGSVDFILMSRFLGVLAFYLQSVWFSFALIFKKFDEDSIVYTRDIFVAFIFQVKKYETIYNVHNWSKKREIFSRLLNKEIKVVCNSEGTKRKIVENGFKRVIAVPNGVDIEEYDMTADRENIRRKLNLPVDKKIAMYVGNLYRWKGVDTLIEAARAIQDPDILFVIVGGDEDDLKTYSQKADGIKNILFAGHKQKKEIPLYLKSSNVLLLPNSAATEESVHHTSPIKMFEYMASGVPIVASDLPSVKEVLNEGNAILVTPDDPASLAEGIRKVLENQTDALAKAQHAYEDVKKYTWREYAVKIMNFLKS
ncbi:MAG: glycosyltransferase family 4 protein [Patescibacteria group bacterium]|nr:glycosyltransferase family 4 protein [bacterium]MDZ4240735.1 glycosyltransferase family 4 protein [Patescibacteria group bacterium]